MKEQKLLSIDGYPLYLHIFEVENPKGVFQVIHGMEEHQERYEGLAHFLNGEGYTVVTSNMRGHGEGAPTLGYFKDKKGYTYLLEDQKQITKFIMDTYKVKEVLLFAHSMGTIIARNLLQTESKNYGRVILSGYPKPEPMAGMGIFLSNIIKLFKGPKYYSKLIANMSTGTFNKGIKNPRTNFDWLSYNEENVDKYIADPYCGHGFTVSGYNDLFRLVKRMGNSKLYKDVKKELPILTLRGIDDPCVGSDKGSKSSLNVLYKAGFSSIKDVSLEHMRHEILNEKEYEKVFEAVKAFLEA